MRILMLAPSPQVKGPLNKHTPYLINALQELGCQVYLEIWGRHKEHETYFEKVFGRFQDILRIRKALKKQVVDLLVVKTAHDWATLSRDIALLLATRHLCPHIILQFHGSQSDRLVNQGDWLFKLASRWLTRLSDASLFLSTQEQREWQQFYPRGRFYMVNNPFVPAKIETKDFNLETDRTGKPSVLLFVGRLIREKGIFDLLDAISLFHKNEAIHLLFVGDGAEAGALKERVAQLGLTDCVTLSGYLEGKELNAAYRKADLFVLPTYWKEGFPTALAEAMGFGLPVVTTPIRGSQDHLQAGLNALFVPAQDHQALAAAIDSLLSNPDLRRRMSIANLEKVKEFAPEKVAQQYLAILRMIADG